ncbi:uncharacterized protein EV420DRAFT_1090135 [Desarmillaria tabescens]|uniref:F-box domain-containing protein n=1 Tax=Armillaria tabescens TaxID=1929756 RepID=A0AA39TZ02_ARMTA|nr:uncharacterized protein EV420DRAFT_1090135 [Desarmillaria tabescens]KAK0463470.1 hypothetical protein EV420DRAFT_1090135 [Desarmillaria tabescens]
MACIYSKQVPQELIDKIVNELHEHRKSLESCSSVCRAFRSPAEAILFRQVSLNGYDNPIFRLSQTTPRVLDCVREVTIHESVETRPNADAVAVAKAVAAFVNLNTVKITGMTWVPGSYRIPAEVMSAFATLPIRTLVLDEVIFRYIIQFSSFMDTFSGVEDITLKHVYCHLVSKNDNPPTSSRTNDIHSLHLSVNEISSNVLRMVADGRLGSLAKLKSLTYEGHPKGKEVPPLLTLVQNPSLQYLRVTGDIPAANLSHIETLAIYLTKEANTQEFRISLGLWMDSLACGEVLSLKKITIRLSLGHQISANDAKKWAELDNVILASRFPELVSFRVILKANAGIDAEQTKELILSHCPTLCTLNVFTVGMEGSPEPLDDGGSEDDDSDC